METEYTVNISNIINISLTIIIGIITCVYAILVYNITKAASHNEVKKAYNRIIMQCDKVRFILSEAEKKHNKDESKKAAIECHPVMQDMLCDYHFIGRNNKVDIHLYNSIGFIAIAYFKRDEWDFDDDKTLFALSYEYVKAGIRLLDWNQRDCEKYIESHGDRIHRYKIHK